MASDDIKVDFPDDVENWETLDELEDLEDELDAVEDIDVDENITDIEHLDHEANQKFICKCGKTYVVKPWFDKHTAKCKEEPNKGKQRKNQQSQNPNLLRKTKNVCWKGRR